MIISRRLLRSAQVSAFLPTEGGYRNQSIQPNYFTIRGDTRLSLGADHNRTTALLESDRELVQPDGTAAGGRYRTLVPATERLAINGLVSGNVLEGVSSTLNGPYEADRS